MNKITVPLDPRSKLGICFYCEKITYPDNIVCYECGLERDNWQCQECGINNIQHIILFGKGISIHHKDGLGRNSKNPNNSIDNLITLCLSCHQKKEMIKRRVSK